MKRVDQLLTEAKRETENTESTTDTGVQDSEYIRALNDAQDKIHSAILLQNPKILKKEKEITVVPEQEAYTLPADVFGTTRIEKVEYSRTGQSKDYYELDSAEIDERLNGQSGRPSYFIRDSERILIQPKPAGAGTLRVTYEKVLPRLDKRRGKVLTVVLDTVNRQITSLILDTTLLTSEDVSEMNDSGYICVVSKRGVIKMIEIPITEVNSSTGEVTVESFTYQSGESIEVGDYVVSGAYSTTNCQLPDITERFLLSFCKWRVQKRDSSNDSREQKEEVDDMVADIMATYARADKTVHSIPIINTDFL